MAFHCHFHSSVPCICIICIATPFLVASTSSAFHFHSTESHCTLFIFSFRTHCLPWARTTSWEQDAEVLSPSLPSWLTFSKYQNQCELPVQVLNWPVPIPRGHKLALQQPHAPNARVSVLQLLGMICEDFKYSCVAWTIVKAF